ncbi:MAG TPA: hypothetical protein VIL63_09085, partial [Terriglobales bacterium]
IKDDGRPSLLSLSLLSILILYVQLILGAMFRHHGMPWWPHVLNAIVVALVLTWTGIRALLQFSGIDAIRRPAVALLFLLVIQLCLGFAAFLTRVAWGPDAAQPELSMVVATVTHVAVGALLLATTAVLTLQVWRITVTKEQSLSFRGVEQRETTTNILVPGEQQVPHR